MTANGYVCRNKTLQRCGDWIGGGATHPKAASTQKKPRARDTGLRKETVVLPWGATTSTAKSLNRATVGLTYGLGAKKQPRLVRKAGAVWIRLESSTNV